MTALAAMLSDRDRRRLEGRLRELRELDAELRQVPDQLPPPVPTPLHGMGHRYANRKAAQ